MADYKRPPISTETKNLLDEKKPDGVSYDVFIKHAVRHAPPLGIEAEGQR